MLIYIYIDVSSSDNFKNKIWYYFGKKVFKKMLFSDSSYNIYS